MTALESTSPDFLKERMRGLLGLPQEQEGLVPQEQHSPPRSCVHPLGDPESLPPVWGDEDGTGTVHSSTAYDHQPREAT